MLDQDDKAMSFNARCARTTAAFSPHSRAKINADQSNFPEIRVHLRSSAANILWLSLLLPKCARRKVRYVT